MSDQQDWAGSEVTDMANFSRFHQVGKKIVCVGRNYGKHALELGNPIPKTPLLFMKPSSSYIVEGQNIEIPRGTDNLHHEIELGVVIGTKAKQVTEKDAMDHVAGYILALDMTARDVQSAAKAKGLPWEMAKGFDTSCPVSNFIDKKDIKDPHDLELWCNVNGERRQQGQTKDMIFTIPHLISYISQYFTLEPNDVILTGTPEGVGPVRKGDVVEGGLMNFVKFSFNVDQRA